MWISLYTKNQQSRDDSKLFDERAHVITDFLNMKLANSKIKTSGITKIAMIADGEVNSKQVFGPIKGYLSVIEYVDRFDATDFSSLSFEHKNEEILKYILQSVKNLSDKFEGDLTSYFQGLTNEFRQNGYRHSYDLHPIKFSHNRKYKVGIGVIVEDDREVLQFKVINILEKKEYFVPFLDFQPNRILFKDLIKYTKWINGIYTIISDTKEIVFKFHPLTNKTQLILVPKFFTEEQLFDNLNMVTKNSEEYLKNMLF
ncbi:hypothetical protein AB9P05_05470 [Roseivirga sp. BDSF3-8]|uniref:hypothetical protein n=1 Tax=Roseivirga sp. BDSF3-8 TaxID=3241598 RepID=UPI0035319529